MAAGGSSSPFGRPPASGGSGLADRAMFSGIPMKAPESLISSVVTMPRSLRRPKMARSPMAGGIGGMMRSKALSSDSSASNSEESSSPTELSSRNVSNKKEKTEKLSTFDKLMSLVKRNGLWPASGLLKSNYSSLNLLFRGQSYSWMSNEVQQELR